MTDRDATIQRVLSLAIDDAPIAIEQRLSELTTGGGSPAPQHRVRVMVVALAAAVIGLLLVGRAFSRSSTTPGAGGPPRSILFERWESAHEINARIWWVQEDGSQAGPIPQPTGMNTEPVWSPDGTKIAFVGQEPPRDEFSTLWVMDADGNELTALTDEFGVDMPAWSPDGSEIAFMGQEHPDRTGESSGPIGVWLVPARGGDPRLILRGGSWESPSWSPDGTRLVLIKNQGDSSGLYTVGSDGSDLARITTDGARYSTPAWSPDGTQIAFSRLDRPKFYDFDVFVMNVDGSHLEQLTDWAGWDSNPVWSSDGKEILFTSDRGATPKELKTEGRGGVQGLGIYVMSNDGSDVRRIFDDGALQDVPTSWRPAT